MYSVEVVNIKLDRSAEYIGRPSILGNDFVIGINGNTRDFVCDQYEEWFQKKIHQKDPNVINELIRLHRIGKQCGIVKLGCFCKPKYRCHGDTIKRYLEENFDFLEILDSNL